MNCPKCSNSMREIALFTSVDWHCDACEHGHAPGIASAPYSKPVKLTVGQLMNDIKERCGVPSMQSIIHERHRPPELSDPIASVLAEAHSIICINRAKER